MKSARLDAAERRALGRAAELLEQELGGELLAVWLYGSRARDERPREDSDVDLFVVVRERGSVEKRVRELVSHAAEEAGAEPFAFQVFVYDPRRLAEEKAIDSLFLREVERDRIVLAGGELPPLPDLPEHERPPMYGPGGAMTRSLRWLSMARRYLADAQHSLERGGDSGVRASTAYYAMLYAARAALSEEGRVARKHGGTWHLMRELFVASGRFDEALVARAQEMEGDRLAADYGGATFSREKSEAHVRDARRFVEAIERLIGAEPPGGRAG
jgi:uncharacterized protein (UPF0332 family)/predicted nucleotidyltransferase